jgi:mevalonate kinase
MMQSNDQVKKDIEAAKQSNDPSKMRAALDEAEKALDSLNGHMNNCMKMMGKRQNMGGMSGKMCGAMMSGQQNNDQEQN